MFDKNALMPVDVNYLYDGSLAGFYCCVHASVYGRELPQGIYPEAAAPQTLFPMKFIAADQDQAARVRASIPAKISPNALHVTETVFLSCLAAKERKLLDYLLLGYQEGKRLDRMLGREAVAPVLDAYKGFWRERHHLLGFIRFADYGGALVSVISPKNFVLPYLARHFVSRYGDENFMIYDKVRHMALICEQRNVRLVRAEGLELPPLPEQEAGYQALWKRFYDAVAIQARENPRCRMTHLPKRYWENMVELQGQL